MTPEDGGKKERAPREDKQWRHWNNSDVELHPVLQALFLGIVGILAAVAVVWLYASYGAWMDDAFDTGRWIWFGVLLIVTFPASLIAWLIMRAVGNRRKLAV